MTLCSDAAAHFEAGGFHRAARAVRDWRAWCDGETARRERARALEYWLGWTGGALEVARDLSDQEADALAAAYDALETAQYGEENLWCACCATEVRPGAALPGSAGVSCALCYEDEVRRRRALRPDEAGGLA